MLSRLNGLALLSGAMVLSLSVSCAARAADDPAAGTGATSAAATGAAVTGDPVAGEKKFYTCIGCHGITDYKNAYPDYNVPKLRHQTASYIVAALQEYKSGERPHPTMHAQASSLSDQDMQDIAAYLQGPEPIKPATTSVGTVPKQASACVSCHGVNGTGVDAPMSPKPAILGGQHVSYLEQALTTYKNGRRKNVVMGGMSQMLATDEDIKIVAEYFSKQPSPLTTASLGSK